MIRLFMGLSACLTMAVLPAHAQIKRFSAGGTVGFASPEGLTAEQLAAGQIKSGDRWSITIDYDLSNYRENRRYALDPVYSSTYFYNTKANMTVGGFQKDFVSLFQVSNPRITGDNVINVINDQGVRENADVFLDNVTFLSYYAEQDRPASAFLQNPFQVNTTLSMDFADINIASADVLWSNPLKTDRFQDLPSLSALPYFNGFFDQVYYDDRLEQIGRAYFALDRDYASFGEASAVPEPASWALMIVGFGLVGAGMRGKERRKGSCGGLIRMVLN